MVNPVVIGIRLEEAGNKTALSEKQFKDRPDDADMYDQMDIMDSMDSLDKYKGKDKASETGNAT